MNVTKQDAVQNAAGGAHTQQCVNAIFRVLESNPGAETPEHLARSNAGKETDGVARTALREFVGCERVCGACARLEFCDLHSPSECGWADRHGTRERARSPVPLIPRKRGTYAIRRGHLRGIVEDGVLISARHPCVTKCRRARTRG